MSLLKYWPIVATLLNLGVLWICWSLRQLAVAEVKKLVDDAVAALRTADARAEDALDDHEGRIIKVEKEVEGLHADIASLPTKADLAEVRGEVKTVSSKVDGARAGIDRIEGYFLAKGVERA